MIDILFFIFFGSTAAYLLVEAIDDDESDTDTEETETSGTGPEETVDGASFTNNGENNMSLTGTEGDDIFTVSSETATVSGLTIEAGSGDDTLDLTGENYTGDASFWLYDSEVYAGDGNDVISLDASNDIVIDGGEGDDTIYAGAAYDGTVLGSAGNDYVELSANWGSSTIVDGGTGDDVIDASASPNSDIYGGTGNDTIITSQAGTGGEAYLVQAYGGDGDDTLIYNRPDAGGRPAQELSLSGGDGADSFELNIHEGTRDDASGDVQVLDLPDFEPGVDMIKVEALIDNEEYEFTNATLEYEHGSGVTSLILTYEHDTEADRNMIIEIHADTVTWDDITFTGENQPENLYYADIIDSPDAA